MPGGLNEVVVPVGANTTGYKTEWLSVLPVLRQVNTAQKEIIEQGRQMAALRGVSPGSSGVNIAEIGRQNAELRQLLGSMKEVTGATGDSAAAARAAAASATALGAAHAGAAGQISGTTNALKAHSETVTETMRSWGLLGETVKGQQEYVRSYGEQIADLHAKLTGGADAGKVFKDALQIRDADVASLGTVRDTARDATSALADTAAAVTAVKAAASGGGSGGSATASILGDALAARFLAGSRAAAVSSPWAPSDAVLAAMAARSGGGGGTFGGGGGGGFSGGSGGGGGGGGGFFLSGSAGRQADSVIAFARTWLPRLHWAMMATNEVLATVGPAAVAAGAAALVGMQGGQQLANRYNAINTTAEALGGAYGQTSGSFLGTGSALQNMQNRAGGGVYELAGAGINFAKSGSGPFLQTGLNTIAMLDRGVANAQINYQNKGTGAALGQIFGGGTQYLQEFGDIGANIGDTFLGLAPHLPGVGGDYLSILKGVTGGLAGGIGQLNHMGLGNVLGGGLAAEAAARIGTPMVGLAGRGLGSLGGLLAEQAPLGSGLEGLGFGLSGAGGALEALGAPEVAGLGISAFLGSKLISSMPSPAERQVAAMQAQIGQSGFSTAWQPLAKAITATTGLAASSSQSPFFGTMIGASESGGEYGRFGKIGPSTSQIYASAATGFEQSMTDLMRAGPQLAGVLDKAGLKGTSMGDAFQIAQNALLDIPHAFGANGQLTQQAKVMLGNYVSALGPMTQNAGGFGAAIASQTIMGSAKMKDLSTVNSSMDSMTQIMSGTPLGASGLAATIGGITNPKALAKGLASVTSAGSGAAWNTFASTSTTTPGIITQLQNFNDQMRTGLTLGATTPGQAAGMTGYEIQQTLKKTPGLKSDPAALAMLMQQGAQQGIGGYYQGGAGNVKENYAALEKSLKSSADSTKQMNADSTSMTITLSRIPKIAQQFAQSMNADVMSQQVAKAATDMVTLQNSVKGTSFNAGALKSWVSDLQKAGISAQAMGPMLKTALQSAGITGAAQKAIMLKVTADTAAAQAKISSVQGKTVTISALAPLGAVTALQGAINAVRGKSVTISVDQVYTVHTTGTAPGGGYVTTPSMGLTPYTPTGAGLNLLPAAYTKSAAMTSATNPYAGGISGRAATGMRVPGFGGGDIFPALLEPGESVVPKELTASVAPFLAMHGVPGFAAGMIPSALAGMYSGTSGGASSAPLPTPAAAQQALDTLLAELAKAGAWKQAGVNIINGITYSLSGTGSDAAKVGKALVTSSAADAKTLASQFTTEMNYARGTAAAAVTGQGYGTAGLLGGFTVPPAGGTGAGAAAPGTPGYNPAAWNAAAATAASTTTPAQSVQQQMQSYLSSEQSFTKDLKTLSKDGLAKGITSQLVAAGPVQGDALAQSILGGSGGAGAANKLWAQIGKASNALGAQAGMSMYGGHLSPGLTGGTVTMNNNISISIAAPGGAGGDVTLTAAQIKTLTEQIQAKLLQQARRNPKTGVKLPGKSA